MWPLKKHDQPKKKTAKPKRGEKEAQSLKRRRTYNIVMRGGTIGVLFAAIVTSVYFWRSGIFEEWLTETGHAVDKKISDAGFMIAEVRITGQKNTPIENVRAALDLYDGQSIISADLAEMLQRVEALPWVKKATLVRAMPDALEVTIQEHEAKAVWQKDSKLFLINQAGDIITDKNLGKFDHLPHVIGKEANKNLTSLNAMKQKYPDLFARVKNAVWVGKRRWDLNFQEGIKIKLPEKGAELAWDQLYEYESRQKILSKEILVIDLRLHGKTVLRLTPEEAERRRKQGIANSNEQII